MRKTILREKLTLFLFGSIILLITLPRQALSQNFKEWKENYLTEFQKFKDKHDKKFYHQLQEEWAEFDVDTGKATYPNPNAEKIPSTDPEVSAKSDRNIDEQILSSKSSKKSYSHLDKGFKDNKKSQSESSADIVTSEFNPQVKEAKVKTETITYFDTKIRFKYYRAFEIQLEKPIDKKSISTFWKHLATKNYSPFIKQVKGICSQLSLNDYGYGKLFKKIGDHIYGKDSQESTLFTWFMLTQSGFGTRIIYNKTGELRLLIRTKPSARGSWYVTLQDTKYYNISFGDKKKSYPQNAYTYRQEYPQSKEKDLNLLIDNIPTTSDKQVTRSLSFEYDDSTYSVDIKVDKKIVSFLRNYPKSSLDMYMDSGMSKTAERKLFSFLSPLLKGKSDIEKVNLILSFVHDALGYKRDSEQFDQKEKYMFPVEAIYYLTGDCDDHAILFSYLVDHLTDLDHLAVTYPDPNHMTAAVHFPGKRPSGKSVNKPITYNGKSYYIAPATYPSATAGMIIPKNQDNSPYKIFDFDSKKWSSY